jgi:hypothetical protein
VRATSRSLLAAVLVTSAIALLDAGTGSRAILLGLLIAGPLQAAATLDTQATAIVGLYALGLAVLLGIPDGIFATTDHLLRLLGVATGAALGVFIAHRGAERDRPFCPVSLQAGVGDPGVPPPTRCCRGRGCMADDNATR